MTSQNDSEQLPPIFLDISPNTLPTEMDSVCMNCYKSGSTRLLLTKIPYFREVMISHFDCPHCGYSDNGIIFAGEFPAKGVRFELDVQSAEDLNRRVIKSINSTIIIPELELTIPPKTQGDIISTVEGILSRCYDGIKQSQENPPQALLDFLDNLDQCRKGLVQFKFILDDPSGNSYIENPRAPEPDPALTAKFYKRTAQQTEEIGLMVDKSGNVLQSDDIKPETIDEFRSAFSTDTPVQELESPCPVCSKEGVSRSCTLSIPHFKEIIIMAFTCDSCGYHNGEVMIGGATSPCGRKTILKATCEDDIKREVIKSELAGVEIPELDLKLCPGTLGGKFTTVEGLLTDIKKQLSSENPFVRGDSAFDETEKRFQQLLDKLQRFIEAKAEFTLIIDDPMSNSYIQIYENETGSKVTNEEYERTFEQNEELGLNDIKTENYETN